MNAKEYKEGFNKRVEADCISSLALYYSLISTEKGYLSIMDLFNDLYDNELLKSL